MANNRNNLPEDAIKQIQEMTETEQYEANVRYNILECSQCGTINGTTDDKVLSFPGRCNFCGSQQKIAAVNLTRSEHDKFWAEFYQNRYDHNYSLDPNFWCYIFRCPKCKDVIVNHLYEKKEPPPCKSCGRKTVLYRTFSDQREFSIVFNVLLDELNATRRNKSACFITTAVCKTLQKQDDCVELEQFRYFRDTYMQKTSELRSEVLEYYEIAPKICTEIEKEGEIFASEKYSMIWATYLKPAFEALNCGDKERTYDLYKNMVLRLKKELNK